jgi:cobalt-zinc-cadmium efflux system membrane fusion protein
LELTIFEQGVPPEFRLYAYDDEDPLLPEQVNATVTLTRLGGRQDSFSFTPQEGYLRGSSKVIEPHSFDVEVKATYAGETYKWAFESYEGRTTISAEAAAKAGIKTEVAGPGAVKTIATLNGTLNFHPDHVARISARFPGVIRKLHVGVGAMVREGDTLATIESNDSLKSYVLKSPINGVVVQRHGAVGESTDNDALFVVADPTYLRATLHVFPTEGEKVRAGQSVKVTGLDGGHETLGALSAVLPDPDSDTPLSLGYVDVANDKGIWHAGEAIVGHVTTEERQVPLVVKETALQAFRDFTVVFAKVGETYEVRMLELGVSDGTHAEVLGGLDAGEEYVTDNSFLIKADIEKSGASHDH